MQPEPARAGGRPGHAFHAIGCGCEPARAKGPAQVLPLLPVHGGSACRQLHYRLPRFRPLPAQAGTALQPPAVPHAMPQREPGKRAGFPACRRWPRACDAADEGKAGGCFSPSPMPQGTVSKNICTRWPAVPHAMLQVGDAAGLPASCLRFRTPMPQMEEKPADVFSPSPMPQALRRLMPHAGSLPLAVRSGSRPDNAHGPGRAGKSPQPRRLPRPTRPPEVGKMVDACADTPRTSPDWASRRPCRGGASRQRPGSVSASRPFWNQFLKSMVSANAPATSRLPASTILTSTSSRRMKYCRYSMPSRVPRAV